VRSSSVEFCELAQWVVVPEWEEEGLVPVKQTFVGLLNVFDRSPHLRTGSGLSNVSKMGTLASSRESSNGSSSLNKFLPHGLVTYPLSFLLNNPRNLFMDTYEISF